MQLLGNISLQAITKHLWWTQWALSVMISNLEVPWKSLPFVSVMNRAWQWLQEMRTGPWWYALVPVNLVGRELQVWLQCQPCTCVRGTKYYLVRAVVTMWNGNNIIKDRVSLCFAMFIILIWFGSYDPLNMDIFTYRPSWYLKFEKTLFVRNCLPFAVLMQLD